MGGRISEAALETAAVAGPDEPDTDAEAETAESRHKETRPVQQDLVHQPLTRVHLSPELPIVAEVLRIHCQSSFRSMSQREPESTGRARLSW